MRNLCAADERPTDRPTECAPYPPPPRHTRPGTEHTKPLSADDPLCRLRPCVAPCRRPTARTAAHVSSFPLSPSPLVPDPAGPDDFAGTSFFVLFTAPTRFFTFPHRCSRLLVRATLTPCYVIPMQRGCSNCSWCYNV